MIRKDPPPSALHTVTGLLQLDLAAVEVASVLKEIGVDPILLKGRSFANWLYEDRRARLYGDVDFLVPPLPDVDDLMARRGYTDAGTHPLRVHRTWIHRELGAWVELHTNLLGIGAPPPVTWEILSRRTESMYFLDRDVMVLDEPARFLHAALHAAGHGTLPGPLEDLRRACLITESATWDEAKALARSLQAVDAFSAGLSLLPEGKPVSDYLQLPPNRSVSVALRLSDAPDAVQSLAVVIESKGIRGRLKAIRSLLWPGQIDRAAEIPTDRKKIRLRLFRGLAAIPTWWRIRHQVKAGSRTDVSDTDAYQPHHDG